MYALPRLPPSAYELRIHSTKLQFGAPKRSERAPRVPVDLRSESANTASVRSGSLFLTALRRRVRFERMKEARRGTRDLLDGPKKCCFICLCGFMESGDFSHELERRSSNLFLGARRIEIEERLNIPAHTFDFPLTARAAAQILLTDNHYLNKCFRRRWMRLHLTSHSLLKSIREGAECLGVARAHLVKRGRERRHENRPKE